MAGTRAPFTSLAALAVAASAHAQTPSGETQRADAGGRDLRALPTVQKPAATPRTEASSLFSEAAAAAEISIGQPAVPSSPVKPSDEFSPSSRNWLLDGVNRLESEEKARIQKAGGEMRGASADGREATDRDRAATVNPFSEYLTQWLSPADRALLGGAGENGANSSIAPWEPRGNSFVSPSDRDAAFTPVSEQQALADFVGAGRNEARSNPYLDTGDPALAPAPAALPESGRDAKSMEVLPSILTPSQNLRPPVSTAPVEQARPAPAAAPTEPLIDDRKYFPQLRRF